MAQGKGTKLAFWILELGVWSLRFREFQFRIYGVGLNPLSLTPSRLPPRLSANGQNFKTSSEIRAERVRPLARFDQGNDSKTLKKGIGCLTGMETCVWISNWPLASPSASRETQGRGLKGLGIVVLGFIAQNNGTRDSSLGLMAYGLGITDKGVWFMAQGKEIRDLRFRVFGSG